MLKSVISTGDAKGKITAKLVQAKIDQASLLLVDIQKQQVRFLKEDQNLLKLQIYILVLDQKIQKQKLDVLNAYQIGKEYYNNSNKSKQEFNRLNGQLEATIKNIELGIALAESRLKQKPPDIKGAHKAALGAIDDAKKGPAFIIDMEKQQRIHKSYLKLAQYWFEYILQVSYTEPVSDTEPCSWY